MSHRAIVNVASDSWVKGQERLTAKLAEFGEDYVIWRDALPEGCPPHRTRGKLGAPTGCVPYAFKPYALNWASLQGYTSLLWCDACILPIQPLGGLWAKIEEDGIWFARNGYMNYEWTADSAYADLFHEKELEINGLEACKAMNRTIPHVVATAFGLDLRKPVARNFLTEYLRLAQTKAFCGPWQNSNAPNVAGRNADRVAGPCGPPDVSGHRHDQTAASVIAWRLGVHLTDPPKWFAYKGGEDETTVLLADGVY